MKRALSIALVFVLALSLFVGCGKKETPLTNAVAYLEEMYQTGDAGEVMTIIEDKDVLGIVTIDGVTYPVEWSITVSQGASDSVKIGESTKENHVLIDLPDVAETDILFAAVATVKDEDGNAEAATFNFKMACTLGDLDLLDKAYALAEGGKLDGTPSLTGDIIAVKTPWDATAKNITVVIQVGDKAEKPVVCNGLTGEYADGLVVGDNVCVTGTLGKVGGVVGFENGCTLVYVNKADGSTPGEQPVDPNAPVDGTTAPNGNGGTTANNNGGTTKPTTTTLKLVTDQAKILKDAFALGKNETTPYIAQLTGKVTAVETLNEKFMSRTVTILVGDKSIECYQMKGNGIDKVKSGDTITVKGVIKNFYYDEEDTKGTVEFAWHEASGTEVTMTKLVAAAAQDLSTTAKILAEAFKLKNGETLQKEVSLTGKVLDIETAYDAQYGNITINIVVENKTIKCYRMKGNGVDKIQPGDTVTVKGIIKNFNGIVEFDSNCEMTKRVAGTNTNKKLTKVDNPKAGVAYKFGMVQPNASKDNVYYLKGGMSGYYMATSSSSAAAIDVYLENTNGGFYLYAMVNGKKQYINMVVSGTHVNGAYENTAKTVYTYDATAKTVIAEVDGTPYWLGTRNDKNYTTVGPCKTEYEGFYCQFYA